MKTVFAIGALSCLALAIWHEAKWWNRRLWLKTRGIVINHAALDPTEHADHPEIEYVYQSTERTFISQYGGSGCPPVGSSVIVIVDPTNNEAEHYTKGNRWLFTIFPLIFGIMLAGITIFG